MALFITELGPYVENTGTQKCLMEPEVAGEGRGRCSGCGGFDEHICHTLELLSTGCLRVSLCIGQRSR